MHVKNFSRFDKKRSDVLYVYSVYEIYQMIYQMIFFDEEIEKYYKHAMLI